MQTLQLRFLACPFALRFWLVWLRGRTACDLRRLCRCFLARLLAEYWKASKAGLGFRDLLMETAFWNSRSLSMPATKYPSRLPMPIL